MTLNSMGETYLRQERPEEAKAMFQRAIAISPNYESASFNLNPLLYQANPDSSWEALSQLTPDYENPTYLNRVDQVTYAVAKNLAEAAEDPLQAVLVRVYYDPDWRLALHKKALANEISFSRQALLDAIYIMEVAEESITFEEAEALRDRYNLR